MMRWIQKAGEISRPKIWMMLCVIMIMGAGLVGSWAWYTKPTLFSDCPDTMKVRVMGIHHVYYCPSFDRVWIGGQWVPPSESIREKIDRQSPSNTMENENADGKQ